MIGLIEIKGSLICMLFGIKARWVDIRSYILRSFNLFG